MLTSLYYFSNNSKLFLKNFYLKSKRSIDKPKNEGPAAYVLPGDDPRPGNQAELLRTLQAQGCEIHRATAAFTVTVKAKKKGSEPGAERPATGERPVKPRAAAAPDRIRIGPQKKEATKDRGSPVSRRQLHRAHGPALQPHRRRAARLSVLGANDPQQDIYDDTAWTMGELGNVEVVRVTDAKVLSAPMDRVKGDVQSPGAINGSGSVYLINHNADNSLVTLRYQLKDVAIDAAEEPFEAAGQKFNRGSFILRKASADDLKRVAAELGIQVYAVDAAPTVKTHPVKAARIALMHTWLSTQDEGWWRLAWTN